MIQNFLLISGVYLSINNADLCPQTVKAYNDYGYTSAVEIQYLGDCEGQGSFIYYCDQTGLCRDQFIDLTITSNNSYHWYNRGYDIEGDLSLSE